jgi:hypothetical protein
VSAALSSLEERDVLLLLGGPPPVRWAGPVVDVAGAGPLCADRPEALTVWAPAGCLAHAFSLLAMFKSARFEDCLVLTDRPAPLEIVPHDASVATVERGRIGPREPGSAIYSCAELRGDGVFRELLAGRARRRRELRTLLGLHRVALTTHGRAVLDEWRDVVAVLFTDGLRGMMPAALRADLEELAQAALDAEHATMGGFHALDPIVRGPAEWEPAAAMYLPKAAAHSPAAAAVVERWLARNAGWQRAPLRRRDELRVAAARALHRLVDDPWLSPARTEDLFGHHSIEECTDSRLR